MVSPDDVLDAMHNDIDEPVATAPEIADVLDVTRKTVSNKLETLQYAGTVARKDVGANAVAWWLTGTRKPRRDADDRERRLAPDQAAIDDHVGERTDAETREGANGLTDTQPSEDDAHDVESLVEELDIPGSGERLQERRAALVDCYRHLEMMQRAEKSDFLEIIDGFDHGYKSPDSFWANAVKGKDTLQSLPHVEPPAPGGATSWRFSEDSS